MTKFEKLGLEKKLLDTLDDAGFTTPFPIQERTIPILLEGSDVIGQAHTGTGKTAAYALPKNRATKTFSFLGWMYFIEIFIFCDY